MRRFATLLFALAVLSAVFLARLEGESLTPRLARRRQSRR